MTVNLLDLREARDAAPNDLPGLRACLAQLIGEPFRFVRVSYGDELTLHFGDLRPARSPKLKNRRYGAYVLGARGSSWLLKAGLAPLMLSSGIDVGGPPSEFGERVNKEDLEARPLVQAEGRVLSASPFVVKPANALGLQLRFSDGSALHVLPALSDVEEGPDDEGLPELADWELISPNGLLSVGPGLSWAFKPSSGPGR